MRRGTPGAATTPPGSRSLARLRGTLPRGVALLEREGEPTALIDAWEGADALWLVDAVSSGAAARTVHRLDASERELPAELFRASTHHVGVAEAVELARALGRLPRQTVLFGIEGGSFEIGDELTPAVARGGRAHGGRRARGGGACTRAR